MNAKFLVWGILLTFCSHLHAQSENLSTVDSLRKAITSAANDTNKVKLLCSLSFEYAYEQPDEGIRTGEQALLLAKQLNWKTGIGRSYSVLASNYTNKADFVKALEYDYKALGIFEETNDLLNQAIILRNIGIVHHRSGDQVKSLEYYRKSMSMYQKLNDPEGVAAIFSNMANTYFTLDSMDQSIACNRKSLAIYRENGNKKGEARLLGNIANYYAEIGSLSESMPFYFQALQMENDLGNQNGVIRNMGNIGETYYDIARDTTGTIHPDSLVSSDSRVNLQKAIFYLSSSIEGAKKLNQPDYILAFEEVLSDAYLLTGETNKALHFYKEYIAIRDSIYNLENSKKLMQTQMQYDYDKKAAAAAAEQEKTDLKNANLRRSLIGGSILLVIIILILLNRFAIKQKSNRELAVAYKSLKETQAQLVRREKEAAFGVVAQRMAHEIFNPLNFVNNLSLISKELIEEMKMQESEAAKDETIATLNENLETIYRNGRRAADLVSELQLRVNQGRTSEFFDQ